MTESSATAAATDGSSRGLAAVATYRRVTWRRLRRGALRWWALALPALAIAGTVAMALAGKWGRDLFDHVVEAHLALLVLGVPAIACATRVGDEVERKTVTFLFARPAPRWALPVGKYLAVTLPLVALFAASLTVSFVLALLVPPAGPSELVHELPALGRALAAAVVGVVSVGAIATFLGSLAVRHPIAAVLGWLLLVEGLLGSLSFVVHYAAVSFYLRALAGVAATTVPAWAAVLVPLVATALALVGAGAVVSGAEYAGEK